MDDDEDENPPGNNNIAADERVPVAMRAMERLILFSPFFYVSSLKKNFSVSLV